MHKLKILITIKILVWKLIQKFNWLFHFDFCIIDNIKCIVSFLSLKILDLLSFKYLLGIKFKLYTSSKDYFRCLFHFWYYSLTRRWQIVKNNLWSTCVNWSILNDKTATLNTFWLVANWQMWNLTRLHSRLSTFTLFRS